MTKIQRTTLKAVYHPEIVDAFATATAIDVPELGHHTMIDFWESPDSDGIEIVDGNRNLRVFVPKEPHATMYLSDTTNQKGSRTVLSESIIRQLKGEWQDAELGQNFNGIQEYAMRDEALATARRTALRELIETVKIACD